MSSKFVRYGIGVLFVVLLLTTIFFSGLLVGVTFAKDVNALPDFLQSEGGASSGDTVAATTPAAPLDKNTLFKPFWEAWDIVHDQYVNQPVDDTELMRGAIRGMLAALGDKHTSYMDPQQYEQQQAPLQGEYEGIGAFVDTTADFVTIINPMPDSPAERAGLKTGDKVIAIDGEDMTGIDGSLVLRRILGPAGTKVSLTILREGETEPFTVEIVREKIVMKSVTSKMLDDNIAYVEIITFGDKTTAELKKALRSVMAEKPAGLVLDLRNNGGGYLDTAIEVVSQFISDGVVMYEEYGNGERRTFNALRGGLATDVPLVVLVNEGTASASEITAGAIQDYARGKLVGVTTYGKGSVQNWIALRDEQGAVRVTVARWLTPKERQIHEIGLTPDVVVEMTEADIEANRDPQLDRAVELLKNAP